MRDTVSPLDRYMTVLEAIASAPSAPGLSEIAAACDLPLGSAHRLINGLQRAELIAAEGTTRKTYRIGARLLRLIHAATPAGKLRLAVREILESLADDAGETCFLARFDGAGTAPVAWAIPTRGVLGYVFPGPPLPPNAAASAKAILAFQPDEVVARVLTPPLMRMTRATKINLDEIRREYVEIRRQGYSICQDEIELGVTAVSCPIELPGVGIIYSVTISALSDRLARNKLKVALRKMQSAVPRLQHALLDLPVDGPSRVDHPG